MGGNNAALGVQRYRPVRCHQERSALQWEQRNSLKSFGRISLELKVFRLLGLDKRILKEINLRIKVPAVSSLREDFNSIIKNFKNANI